MSEEFEMIGAETLLLPLTPPDGALSGGEQEVQEKEEGWHMGSLASDCAARGNEFKSTQRQSDGTSPGQPTTGPAWLTTAWAA